MPLAVFALSAALVIPGAGWLFPAFLQLVVVLGLAACLAGDLRRGPAPPAHPPLLALR